MPRADREGRPRRRRLLRERHRAAPLRGPRGRRRVFLGAASSDAAPSRARDRLRSRVPLSGGIPREQAARRHRASLRSASARGPEAEAGELFYYDFGMEDAESGEKSARSM